MTFDHYDPLLNPACAPWALEFDRHGTEDVAVILDADGGTLVTSRYFWRPGPGDPESPTLAAVWRMTAAPKLLHALQELLRRTEDGSLRHGLPGTAPDQATLALARTAIAEATAGPPPAVPPPNVYHLLTARRQIAAVWGVDDVRAVRPDLRDDQAWAVLQSVERHQDAAAGITWATLACHARMLFGDPPAADEPAAVTALTREAFEAAYPLIPNPLTPDGGWADADGRGCLFETFGAELAFVRSQDPRRVWTLLDDDTLVSGLRWVNRVGYLVSTTPVPDGEDFQVRRDPTDGEGQP